MTKKSFELACFNELDGKETLGFIDIYFTRGREIDNNNEFKDILRCHPHN